MSKGSMVGVPNASTGRPPGCRRPVIRWGVIGPGAIATGFAEAMQWSTAGPSSRWPHVRPSALMRSPTGSTSRPATATTTALAADPTSMWSTWPRRSRATRPTPWPCSRRASTCSARSHSPSTREQAARMVDEARGRGLFLMEAIWSRFLPAYRSLVDVIGEGRIGEPLLVEADFGFRRPVDPDAPALPPELGGGALLDLGIYPIQLCYARARAASSTSWPRGSSARRGSTRWSRPSCAIRRAVGRGQGGHARGHDLHGADLGHRRRDRPSRHDALPERPDRDDPPASSTSMRPTRATASGSRSTRCIAVSKRARPRARSSPRRDDRAGHDARRHPGRARRGVPRRVSRPTRLAQPVEHLAGIRTTSVSGSAATPATSTHPGRGTQVRLAHDVFGNAGSKRDPDTLALAVTAVEGPGAVQVGGVRQLPPRHVAVAVPAGPGSSRGSGSRSPSSAGAWRRSR